MNSVVKEALRQRITVIDEQMDRLADERTILVTEIANDEPAPPITVTVRQAPERRDTNPRTGKPYKMSKAARANMRRARKRSAREARERD